MKVASILTFLALLVIPAIISAFYAISRAEMKVVTKGEQGAEDLYKPSPKSQQFLSQHKKLFFAFLACYLLLELAVVIWMFYEIFAPAFVERRSTIISATAAFFTVLEVVGVFIWLIVRHRRMLKKFPPPNAPMYSKEYADWAKTFQHDSVYKYFEEKVGRTLLFIFGLLCGLIGLPVLIVFLLNLLLPSGII